MTIARGSNKNFHLFKLFMRHHQFAYGPKNEEDEGNKWNLLIEIHMGVDGIASRLDGRSITNTPMKFECAL